ncbi:hypothetical protein CYL21_5418 [Plasmodium falciparum NF54]|uniref:Uncharacterized protein PF13_0277 n=3 Tax=Plasmodium falciparum TaxID=5833 RepID=YPF01_PLAF7|nr:conserved Plasmodium protein, unknown function [Plasmodium falciparum 3D7]Q8IDG7.1 RecName: Full=Uncharacterized protein PF13_0277 [Plasmodium falciparum 3D7]KAF4326451.1 hypothetical protein CYL21_5418 [Plasmodium falciparum NF54]PKC44619.1 hypothetical protein CK202_4434 [Plasmodium falciparum NF54]CAD52654.1 conserved Plasmodium protein, unknown function [Plasmodium falciparum 3D7]|eukprot:XP_001350245.1 conserved Plasmodium protein, unknown function [Plasmodium falciparum 3D7]
MDFFIIIFILLLSFFFFDYNFCSRGLVFYIGNKSLKLLKKCNNLEKVYRSTIYLIFPFLQHIFVHIFYYYIEKKKEYLNNLIFEQSKEHYDIKGQKEFEACNFKKEDIFNYIIETSIKIKNYVYNKALHIFFFIVEYTNIYENINLNCHINTREVLNNNNFGVVIIDYYLPNTSIKKKKKKKKKDQTYNYINDSEKIDLYDLVNIKQEKKIKFVLIDNKWKHILGLGKIEDPNVQHLYLQDTVLIQYLQFSWIFKNHFFKKLYNDRDVSTHNYYEIKKNSMQQNDRDGVKEQYKKTCLGEEELIVDGNTCNNNHLNDHVNIKDEEYFNNKNYMNDQEEIIIRSLKKWNINKENVCSNKEENFNLITNNDKLMENTIYKNDNKDLYIETQKMKEDHVYNNSINLKKTKINEIEQNNLNTQNNNCYSNKEKYYINQEKKKQQLKYIKNENMIRDKLKMQLNRWKYKNIKGIIVILPEIFYNYINMNEMENKIPIYYFLKKDIKIDTFTVIAKLLGYICIHIHININFGFSIPFIFKSKTTNILNISNNFNLHMNKNLFNIYNENGTSNIKGTHTNISSDDKKLKCSKHISKQDIKNNINLCHKSVSNLNDHEKENKNKQDKMNIYSYINDHINIYNNDNNDNNSIHNNLYNKQNDNIKDTINYMDQNDKNNCHDMFLNNNYNEQSNEYHNHQQCVNNINDENRYQNYAHNNNNNNYNYIHTDYTNSKLNSIVENKFNMDDNYTFLFSTPFSFFSDNYNDLNIAMNHFKAIFKNYNFVFLCFNDGTNIMLNYFLEKIYKKKKNKTPGGMTTLISTAGVAENIKNTFNLYNTNAYKCHINNYKKKHVHDTKGDTYDNEKKKHSKLYPINKSEEDKKSKCTLHKANNKSNIMSLFFGEKKKKKYLEHEQMNQSQRFKKITKKWDIHKILSDIKGNDKSSFINQDKKINERKYNEIDKNDSDDSNASYDDEKILSHVVKEQMHSGEDEKEELGEPKEKGSKSCQEEEEQDEEEEDEDEEEEEDQGVNNYDNYVDGVDRDVENYDNYIDDVDRDVENYDKGIANVDHHLNDVHKDLDDHKKVEEVIADIEKEDKNVERKNVNLKGAQNKTEYQQELVKKLDTDQNINIDKKTMNQINNSEFSNNVENVQDKQKNKIKKEEMFTKNTKKNMKIKMKDNKNNDMGKLRNIKEKLKKKKMETLLNLSKLNIFHKNSEQISENYIKEEDNLYRNDYNTNESKIWSIYESHVSNDPRGSASTYKGNSSINKFANMSLSNFASFIKKHKNNNSNHSLVGSFKDNLEIKEIISKTNCEKNLNKYIDLNKENVMEIDMKEFVEPNIKHDVEKNVYKDINKNTNNEIVKTHNIVDEKNLNTQIQKYVNYDNEKNIKEDVERNVENNCERHEMKNSEIKKIKLNILEKFRKKEIRKCDNMDDAPRISNKFRYSFFKIRNRFKHNFNACDNKTNQEKKNMERDKMMINSFIKNKNAMVSDANSTSTADSNFDDYGKKHTKEICILINFSYNNMFDIFNYPDDFIETKKRKFSIVHKFFYSLNIFFNSFSTLIKQRYFFRCTSELSNFLKRSLFYDFYNNLLCKISTDDQDRNNFLLDINNSSNEYDVHLKRLSDITYICNSEKPDKYRDLLENKSNITSIYDDKKNVSRTNMSTYINKDMECTWHDNNQNKKSEKNFENIKNENIQEIDKIDLKYNNINNNNNNNNISENNNIRSNIGNEIYNNVSDMNKKNSSNNVNNPMEYNKDYTYNNSSIRDNDNNINVEIYKKNSLNTIEYFENNLSFFNKIHKMNKKKDEYKCDEKLYCKTKNIKSNNELYDVKNSYKLNNNNNNNNMIFNETYNNNTFFKNIYSDSFESKIRVYFNIKSLYEKWKIYFEDKQIDISIQDKFLYNLSFIYNVYNYLILIYIYTYYNEESYLAFCNNQKFYQFIEKIHCYFNEKKNNHILYKNVRNSESFNTSIIPRFLNYHDYKLLKVFFFMLQNSSNKFISKNIHLFNFPVVFIFSSDSKNFNFNHFDIIKISKNNNIIYLLYKRGNEGLFLSGLKPYIWIYRVLFDFVESLFLSSFDN